MILSKQIIKNSMKGLKISGILGLSTLVITGGLIHNALYAATITPTTNSISELTSTLYRAVPTGYTKPSYTFTVNPKSDNPTANDLSATDAAEIISQEIYRYFKVDISGKTLALRYHLSRSRIDDKPYWSSKVVIDSNSDIYVNIDSVTGEVKSAKRDSKTPNHPIANPSKNEDEFVKQVDAVANDIIKGIESNAKANSKKIQDLIDSSGFIPETTKSITHERCVVSIDDEPTRITIKPSFSVTTASGKNYSITLSEDLMSVEGFRVLASEPVAKSITE